MRKIYGCNLFKIVGIAVLAFLLLTAGAGAANQIDSCTTVSSPGEYVLSKNIMNSGASSCINITSSDVLFDGSGFMIGGVISEIQTGGVYVYNPTTALTNVTLRNLNVTDWYYGIYYNNTGNGIISGINASNSILGIFLTSSSNNTLSNNNISDNGDGIDVLSSSNYNMLSGNIISNNKLGISLGDSGNNDLSGNDVWGNIGGIMVRSSSNNNLRDNSVIGKEGSGGISLFSSNNNALRNNNVLNNSYDGISLFSSSNNALSSNDVSHNGRGIYLELSSNNTLRGNIADWNGKEGIAMASSSNNYLSGNNASNNNKGIFLSFSGNNNLSNNIADWNGKEGISVISSIGNNLGGNNASNNNNGIYVNSSSNNVLRNNIVDSNDISGIFLDSSYLFSWNEAPGKDNFRLAEYLRQKFGIEWAKIATIQKINDGKTIKVSKNRNYLLLMLNDEKIDLEIDDGRADKFIAKIENGKLNIYDPSINNSLDSNSAWNNGIGIRLRDSSNNSIYNNIFNNTINFKNENSMNQWNITKTKAPSIIGGPYLGGNAWVNPNRKGFSQTCEDSDDDGICDSYYALDGNNTDYLPLMPPAITAAIAKSLTAEKAAGFEAVQVIITFLAMGYIFWRKKR